MPFGIQRLLAVRAGASSRRECALTLEPPVVVRVLHALLLIRHAGPLDSPENMGC